MMVLLTKREYNELLQKASSLEVEIERRLVEEKRKILLALRSACKERDPFGHDQVRTLARLVDELLR